MLVRGLAVDKFVVRLEGKLLGMHVVEQGLNVASKACEAWGICSGHIKGNSIVRYRSRTYNTAYIYNALFETMLQLATL